MPFKKSKIPNAAYGINSATYRNTLAL